MKKVLVLVLSLLICSGFICGCYDDDSKEDDSWKSKTWDQLDDGEREKAYDYTKDIVEKSRY